MRWIGAAFILLTAACAAPPEPSIYRDASRIVPYELTPRPEIAGYGSAIAKQPLRWSPTSVARDFDRLMFRTEWGGDVPILLKWEKPVRVALASDELRLYRPFLEELLDLIRSAAPGVEVEATTGSFGEITLRSAPRAEMDAIAADALCFFIPYATDWELFKRFDVGGANGWEGLRSYEAITVFIPANAAPHEIRSCILEEVTQALGPGNDLRDLEDSIFNDDNAHVWPTSFDLLILRTLYDDQLRNGQSPRESLSVVTKALRREPLGAMRRPPDDIGTEYDEALAITEIETDIPLRRRAAQAAISLARTKNAAPHRLGEAYKAAAFVAFEDNSEIEVLDYLARAERAHAEALGPDSPHLARVRSELAINLINLGEHERGLDVLAPAIPVFAANGADWQLSHALRWRAIALSQLARFDEGRDAALAALDWARYVYGRDSRAAAAWGEEFVELGLLTAPAAGG